MYSDSDNSSVYTSEDDFNEDKFLVDRYFELSGDYQKKQSELAAIALYNKLHPPKTERELRLEKLGIVDESKKELTDAQKEYRSKIWPKHYVPELKEYKSLQLDLVGAQLKLRVGGVK